MPGYRDAARAIDLVKYRDNFDDIFGKRKSIIDESPVLPKRKRKTLRRNGLDRKYFSMK